MKIRDLLVKLKLSASDFWEEVKSNSRFSIQEVDFKAVLYDVDPDPEIKQFLEALLLEKMPLDEKHLLRPVLVGTTDRFVVFGYTYDLLESVPIRLISSRMVLYWPEAQQGRDGLAVAGPLPGAKLGPKTGFYVTHCPAEVIECTPEAVECFESFTE